MHYSLKLSSLVHAETKETEKTLASEGPPLRN